MDFEHFKSLEEGWDGYAGVAPNLASIEKCREMVEALISAGCPAPKVLADAAGGMAAIWRGKIEEHHKALTLFFPNEDSMYLTITCRGRQEIFERPTSSGEIFERIQMFLGDANASA